MITEVQVPNTPILLLLNIWETDKPSPIALDLIVLLLAAAKSLITLHWKTTRIPSIKEWFIKLWDLFLQDKISVAILCADNLPTPPNIQERWMPLLSAFSTKEIDKSLFDYHVHFDLLSHFYGEFCLLHCDFGLILCCLDFI